MVGHGVVSGGRVGPGKAGEVFFAVDWLSGQGSGVMSRKRFRWSGEEKALLDGTVVDMT